MDKVEETKIELDNKENQEGEEECYASVEEYFLDCCRYGELPEVIETIKEGVDINYFDNNLNSCLHMASANGHVEVIEELLKVKKGEKVVLNINARNADGSTALHWAVINDQKKVIEVLLQHGADCNIKSKYDHTPLDEALLGGRYEIAELLASKTKPDEEELKEQEEDNTANGGTDDEEDRIGEEDDDNEEEISDS